MIQMGKIAFQVLENLHVVSGRSMRQRVGNAVVELTYKTASHDKTPRL